MKLNNIYPAPEVTRAEREVIMCQVITFPTNRIEHTNAYENLRVFFDMCNSPESCKFYLETVESLASDEYITTAETLTLRRVGRQKYKELSSPQKTDDIQARISHYGTHYYIDTTLDLKGRGITLLETERDGNKKYRVTLKAFEKLESQYNISTKNLLD